MTGQLSLFDAGVLPIPEVSQTVREAQHLIDQRKDEGIGCPCCGQLVKLYKRTIHAQMARWLIRLVQISGKSREWVDQIELPARGGDFAKLRHWGLVEHATKELGDASRRSSGIWRPTELGRRFATMKATVPKYAHLYRNRCVGHSGPTVHVTYCLGKRFDYSELWNR